VNTRSRSVHASPLRYSYDPYGGTATASESDLRVPNIVRYAGGALERNAGLTKFGLRYYNPALGAFTQQDTVVAFANPGNGNRYSYVGADPVNLTDPTGLFFLLTYRCSSEGFWCPFNTFALGVVVSLSGLWIPAGIVAIAGVGVAGCGFSQYWFNEDILGPPYTTAYGE